MRTEEYGFEVITAEELSKQEFSPLQFLVEGLLPLGGAAMLAAPPKRRKSFLAQDLILSVALGRPFLNRKTLKGRTLYLALEDGERRLQERQKAILGDDSTPDAMYAVAAPKLDTGLLDAIRKWKSKTGGVLVVVDVFQRVRPAGKTNDYSVDYQSLAPLNDLANELCLTIMVIHHTRKLESPDDVFADISGTNGLFGALTTCWILKSGEGDIDAKLFFQGKDIESDSLKLHFDRESLRFVTVTDAEKTVLESGNALVRVAKRLLNQAGTEWRGTATEFGSFAITQPEFAGCGRRPSSYGRELNGDRFRQDALTEGFDVACTKGSIRFYWI